MPAANTTQQTDKYDIAIIGSGIAGSALGSILARHGLKVVIFEAGSHPRFAIGESMILETSETMRAMAELFDVPEMAYFSSENYFNYIGTSHGVKRHFSFLHHTPGQPHDPKRSLQAIIPKQPHGHELHLFRQDTDAFLAATAVKYGADLRQNTKVQDIAIDPGGVDVITGAGDRVRADYVVDAGGFRSILAERFELRDRDLLTHSRGLFTHMVDVPSFHETGGAGKANDLPFPVEQGTLHHIFDGGWLWVIPIDNHPRSTNPLCSVGLLLDPRLHPERNDLTAEAEFFDFIGRYPSIHAQLGKARSVRSWTRAGRIQYSSKKVVGDRFALLGHAVGFIDPLFSKGLYESMMSTLVLAHLLLDAHAAGDYATERFRPLEKKTLAFVRTNDRLIANSFHAFRNIKLWEVYSALWMTGAYLEFLKLNTVRAMATTRADYVEKATCLTLAVGGFDEYFTFADRIDTIMEATDPTDEAQVDRAVAEMRAIFHSYPWVPQAFLATLDGKTYLPKNKLRLSLLKRDEGFMGKGAYRQHFFGDHTVAELVKVFVEEKVRYSVPVLNWRRRARA